jgi:hypothetical protein
VGAALAARREAAAVAEALRVHEEPAPERPLHRRPVLLQKPLAQAHVADVLGEVELGDVDVAAVEAAPAVVAVRRRPHAPRAAVSSAKTKTRTNMNTTTMMRKASRLKWSDANLRRVTDLPVVAAAACNSNVAALVAATATMRRKLK